MSKTSKRGRSYWFRPLHRSYIPQTWQGWLLYLPYIGFMLWAATYATQVIGNNWYAYFCVATQWIAAAAIMTVIAARTSK